MIIRLLILLCFVSFSSFSANAKEDDVILQSFQNIDQQLCYNPHKARFLLDSLCVTFSPSDSDKYQAYIHYSKGFLAFQNGDYDLSLDLADSALSQFLWDGNREWEAKTLFLIGGNSEVIRLNDEAFEAYSLVVSLSTDPALLCRSYLGLARYQKRVGDHWIETLKKSTSYANQSEILELKLLIRLSKYWFYADSICYESDLNELALQYEDLGLFIYAANAKKLIAIQKRKLKEYEQALSYLDEAIKLYAQYSIKDDIYLASIYASKGILYHKKGDVMLGNQYNEKALQIHDSIGCSQNNSSIYKYLYKRDTLCGHYKAANIKLEKYNECQLLQSNLRVKRTKKLTAIFLNRTIIIEEIKKLESRQRCFNALIFTLSLLFVFSFFFIAMKYRRKHQDSSQAVEGLQKDKKQLLTDTGDLLMKVNAKQHYKEIEQSLFPLQQKIEKYVLENSDLSSELRERYATVMLSFKEKLDFLTESERRYAALIVLDIPTKHIAGILNVKIDSVKRNRNFIRRKLGIANSQISLKDKLSTFLDEN